MCGRFRIQATWAELREMFDLTRPQDIGRNMRARYNVAPTQNVPFIHLNEEGRQIVSEGRWWLVAHWAKEIPKYALFNARSEDAYKKPSFRDAFKAKRCLIPADGYYEWTRADDGKKDPWLIHLNTAPFSFAGLWAHNATLDITSCTILTAQAKPATAKIHHRMPIILHQERYDAWLDRATSVNDARELLTHNHGNDLQACRVGREINSSKYDGPPISRGS